MSATFSFVTVLVEGRRLTYIKMVIMLNERTTKEHYVLMHFYFKMTVQRRFTSVYIENFLLQKVVHYWGKNIFFFMTHTNCWWRPTWSYCWNCYRSICAMGGKIIKADTWIMTDSVAAAIGCSRGSTYSILHNQWKFL